MDISVADFAEQLLAQENATPGVSNPTFNPTPSHIPTAAHQQAPDISNIEVPVDFVNTIVEGRIPEKEPLSPQPVENTESSSELNNLLEEVRDLLIGVKAQLTEMTAVGGLGAGPSSKSDDDDDVEKLFKKILKKKKAKRK